jgi:ribose transport system substrate-binding protein
MNHIPRRRGLVGGALVLTLAATLLGCSSASDDAATSAADPEDVTAVQSIRSMSNPYHANWADGGDLFGEWAGTDVVTIVDEGDSQTQLSKIRALGAEGKVFALNVDPNDSSTTEAIVKAVTDAGGYVVTQWNKPDDLWPWDVGDNWVAHISFNGETSGKEVSQTLFDEMGGSGNIIALQGILDNVPAKQRFAGLQQALEENPDITLLADQTANWDRAEAFSVTQTLLSQYQGKVNGIWAANDNMALGAYEALTAAGLDGTIPIVGFDAVPEALEAIQDSENTGYLATVSTDPWWQGGAGLSLAYQAATGELDVSELSHEQRAFYGSQTVVTGENVGDFLQAPPLDRLTPDLEDPFLRSQGAID